MPTVRKEPANTNRKRQKETAHIPARKTLSTKVTGHMREIADAINSFVKRHPLGAGIAAATIGAACIAVGAEGFKAEIAAQLLAAAMPKVFGLLGAGGGAALGLLGAAGVAIGGFAFGVPAIAIGAAGAWLLGHLGMSAGALLHSVLGASLPHVIQDVGIIGLGVYLLAWGFDCMARDSRVGALLTRAHEFSNELMNFQRNALAGVGLFSDPR